MTADSLLETLSPRRSSAPRIAHRGAPGRGPKILLYSHDTAGLGNIRRTLLLAEAFATAYPSGAVLVVTGSPVIHAYRIPDGVDYVKLPSLDRVAAERYEPRFLRAWCEEVRSTRRQILEHSILGFAPDLLLVDKRPAGIDNELLPSLRALRRRNPRARVVLGLRDILDAPERTRASLRAQGWFEIIDGHYDEVWIYGSPEVFDAAAEYDFPASVRARTHFCGYLARSAPPVPVRSGTPHVVVATGGGGDGSPMIRSYLDGLLTLPRSVALRTTVVLGPEMPRAQRDALLGCYGALPDVEFLDFDPDPLLRYARADVVVSMAGYNTVCELLSLGKRTVLVPRSEPVREQLIRARRLAQLGLVEIVEPSELAGDALIQRVLAQLSRGERPRRTLDFSGVERVLARAHALLAQEAPWARLASPS